MKKTNQQKVQKSVIKGEFKFEDYKVCLEVNQIEKEMNRLKKSKIDTGSLKGNHKKS